MTGAIAYIGRAVVLAWCFTTALLSLLRGEGLAAGCVDLQTNGWGSVVSASGDVCFENDGVYSFTITPNSGYFIRSVTGCDPPFNASGATVPTVVQVPIYGGDDFAYVTLGVTFAQGGTTYSVTASCQPSGAGSVTPATSTVSSGQSSPQLTFSVVDPAYMLSDVKVNGISFGIPAGNLFSVPKVVSDTSVIGVFAKKYSIGVTVTPSGTGTVSPGSGAFPGAATPTFSFGPGIGHAVKEVTVDGTSVAWNRISGSYTFPPLSSDHHLQVVFAEAYTVSASAGSGGSISPSGAIRVVKGESQDFTVTPAPGYLIKNVAVDGIPQGSITSYTFSGSLSGDHFISVEFRPAGANMQSYCNVPPYAASPVKPNLLLMIDNSASMGDLAYTGSDPSFCFDNSFDNGRSYPGYFEQSRIYRYDFGVGGFVAADALSAPCNAAGTTYLCLNMASAPPPAPRTANRFLASGRFLNWLAISKLDVEKWVLTGGKLDPASGMLQGESRGCQGKRFVKAVPDAPGITFAVRGPLLQESDFAYDGAGATRIEVYDKSYPDACRSSVTDWIGGNASDLLAHTAACLGNTTEPYTNGLGVTTTIASKAGIYNTIINACYVSLAQNKEVSADQVALLQDACARRYRALYGNDPVQIAASRNDDGVCSSKLRHPLYNNNVIGFIGACLMLAEVWNPECTNREISDYCHGVVNGTVTDPSATATMSATGAALPGFILDAGVSSLGGVSGTFTVRVPPPPQSQGLVQEFGDLLDIGAMVFKPATGEIGAPSECGQWGIPCTKSCTVGHAPCASDADCNPPVAERASGSCAADPAVDGAKVISYIGFDLVGDHSSGLIAAIDGIRPSSWSPLAESFFDAVGYFANRKELRIAESAWNEKFPPSRYRCQKNHILLVSDGISSADRHAKMEGLAATYASLSGGSVGADPQNGCPSYAGSRSLDDLAWIAKHRNIKTLSLSVPSPDTPVNPDESITTHVVFTGSSTGAPGECDPSTLMRQTAAGGGGEFVASPDPANLYNTFRNVLLQIAGGSKSGTDPAVFTTGRGNGSVFLQEFFYPQKSFDRNATSASWIGEMQALWYYIDSFVGSTGAASSIRDDTGFSGGNRHDLVLGRDRVVQFSIQAADPAASVESNASAANGGGGAVAKIYLDPTGTGLLSPQPLEVVDPETVPSLWRAGAKLWQRSASDRLIYTQIDGRNLIGLTELDPSSAAIRDLLQATDESEGRRIVSFATGVDEPGTRTRTVAYPPAGSSGLRVWKLGDIVSSTPKVQSASPLNSYHLPPPRGYGDSSYGNLFGANGYTDSASYRNRGMVYVGANDGMLHAFQLGRLEHSVSEPAKATLSGGDLGREEWAFVPKNALPYLKYLTYPNYPHLNFVDGSLSLIDASIGDPASSCSRASYWECARKPASWRTVLVGAMGLAGASRPAGDSCSEAADVGTCVKAPENAGAGLSSYFALDVTDQLFDPVTGARDTSVPPRLLWEFSDPDLGYASSGVAVVRIASRSNDGSAQGGKNGHWYAVFGSGPTGPIDGSSCQFKGRSGQSLKVFVVDLNASPPLIRGTNYWVLDTGIADAFAGTVSGGGIDADKWNPASAGFYQDDAVYLGFAAKGPDGTWSDGGVIRVLTGENPDPGQWRVNKVIDGIGPVTSAVAKLQDRQRKKLWLYFGTGRYFCGQDDMRNGRALFGVTDSCYRGDDTIDPACGDSLHGFDTLSNKSSDATDSLGILGSYRGWYIDLDAADSAAGVGAERVISDPASLTGGAVFFTTYTPSFDPCRPEGTSHLWGVKYDTGGALVGTRAEGALRGKALMRLSNGSVNETLLGKETFAQRGNRRGAEMAGAPGGIRIVTNSGLKPVKKVIHVQER